MRHLLYNLIALKNIETVIFFLDLQTFNCNFVNAFAVLCNSIEKYGQKHALENTLLGERERERKK